jgi:hypothetical protein
MTEYCSKKIDEHSSNDVAKWLNKNSKIGIV